MISPIQLFFALGPRVTSTTTTTTQSSLDPDAQVYITRWETASGTSMPQSVKTAFDTFAKGLESNGLKGKFKNGNGEIWPVYGGTSATHALGFFNQFNFTFVGTNHTHTADGMQGGTSSYVRTGVSSSNLTFLNSHLSIYSQTNSGVNVTDFGSSASNNRLMLSLKFTTGIAYLDAYSSTSTWRIAHNNNALTTNAFYIGSRNSATYQSLYRNGTRLDFKTANYTQTAFNFGELFIGNYNNAGTVQSTANTNRVYSYASIGLGFSDTEAAAYTTLVNNLQTALNRNQF